ncbi:MAG TPA: hypothetical protein VFX51_26265 [Solirubrobacteraceae bacterium]|nr:hypothetical protein [Solirubrobacteraceae bacterium]
MSQEGTESLGARTLGNAVGVIAGAVAVVYLLGGLIFSIRLLLDAVSISSTASVVGQLSRELLITTGLVQGIGPAVLVGLAAGVLYGALRRPIHPAEMSGGWPDRLRAWPNLRTTSWPKLSPRAWLPLIALTPVLAIALAAAPHLDSLLWIAGLVVAFLVIWVLLAGKWRKDQPKAAPPAEKGISTWIALLPLASLLALPSSILLLGEDDQSWWELIVVAGTVAVNWAVAVLGWYVLRSIPGAPGEERKHSRYRAQRGVLAGLVWAGICLPGALMFASFLPLENAHVCLRSSQQTRPIQGRLIAETGRSVLLVDRAIDGRRNLVSVPADQVRRVYFGPRVSNAGLPAATCEPSSAAKP